jgi:hypothetical protein
MSPHDESEQAQTVHASAHRPTRPQLVNELRDVAIAAALAATAPLLRRWHSHWGATSEEASMPMPGDGLVRGCEVDWTRAITIDAPPDQVWPWLVQVGFGRAGFYSDDRLDNVVHPSAAHIDPQGSTRGDRLVGSSMRLCFVAYGKPHVGCV